ncbi:MAG: YkgJ family cysteine cluster protein [Syntrophobacteraceae bacterium]
MDQFQANWFAFLEAISKESSSLIPPRRIRYQIEQTSVFKEVASGWDKMNGSQRLDAWKRLLVCAEDASQEMLPACVQCGECCRRGSPTLHKEDFELLQSGKIPWDSLLTLRKGEPARSPFDGKPFILIEERIKIKEKEGIQECVFLNNETDQCSIYLDRPMQCRAQACWDPIPARDLAEMPFLLREHFFEGVDLLIEIMAEHDKRCDFGALAEAFERLHETNGENVQEVLQLLAYEEHFRSFVSEQFKIPQENMELMFGRSFAQMVPLFGYLVTIEPDGTHCLVPDTETAGKA